MPESFHLRTCHFCGGGVAKDSYCPTCTAAWESRPHPASMTAVERMAEMEALGGPVEVPFSKMHARIEALVGRPVWTHEMGLNWDGLVREAAWNTDRPTMEEIVDLIPAEKRVVVVMPDDEVAPDR